MQAINRNAVSIAYQFVRRKGEEKTNTWIENDLFVYVAPYGSVFINIFSTLSIKCLHATAHSIRRVVALW